MAQVLTSVIQTTGPLTMPYSPSDAYKNTPNQPNQPQPRVSQMPRTQQNGNSGGTGYRGTAAPIAPYAFNSTPQLRQENRSVSAPTPQALQQPPSHTTPQSRLGHPSHPSSSSDSTVSTSGSSNRSSGGPAMGAKDDSDIKKPASSVAPSITLSTSIPDLSFSIGGDAPAKPSPGRYRRGAGRTDSSNSVPTGGTTPTQRSTTAGTSYITSQSTPNGTSGASELPAPFRPGHSRANSADDMQVIRPGGVDSAKRYRRRSFSGLEAENTAPSIVPLQAGLATGQNTTTSPNTTRPSSSSRTESRPDSNQSHERKGSVGSASSNNSSTPQSRPAANTQRSYASVAGGSSSKAPEPNRRQAPSPLSHPISPSEPATPAAVAASAAMQHLNAVNDKDKGMKSRLRRAFSFGSAAELRRASAENNISAERAKLRKDKYQNDEDAEQAAIIAKQEAAGIGAGIYSGQGGIGSTDNLSIQSAASSASVMLRKMGHGMKKGTKSIKGLFRPKSVIGVPAADGPITRPSVGQVSLVTVEAERQKVNVNADPHEQARGGTGYPRLERNSIDAGRSAEIVNPSNPGAEAASRKSIVGSDRDRAEVLSSMKKGILKRAGTNSDSGSPVLKPVDVIPNVGSSRSSSPDTPKTEVAQTRNEDYFAKPPRIHNGSTRSLPTTPHGGMRNISFSPRIQFHDAWSPQDYDRRGDIATCNRLTPMLAQQIKEELNSFKMEMEVHELSKPHTHFF
ncbi:Immunoglobulin A1 protease [Pyrenophora seminiperda CCB06]|uniref:Immunoglobulin A1 protease n=1 Tax=Pyrenophora seminiperda CCB06 TaxID=1302712 RepID=A0A3M7M2A5_9PLEO|nr:Immunoglobulin A1 protease [Pyrenophora seminiperda CCB06]